MCHRVFIVRLLMPQNRRLNTKRRTRIFQRVAPGFRPVRNYMLARISARKSGATFYDMLCQVAI
jgi:hypothetical protein